MTVAVIGAGALGTLTALRLARAGRRVDIVDDRPTIWDGASGAGEGKVHLGYVYALASERSLQLMVDAASQFAPAIDEALGRELPWNQLQASPFRYLVPEASTISPEEFEAHGERLDAIATADGPLSYLGESLPSVAPRAAGRSDVGAVYETEERSVDVVPIRDAIERELDAHSSTRRVRGRIVDASRTRNGWLLDVHDAGEPRFGPYDTVVNCAWERAAALDAIVGRSTSTPNLRLRAYLTGVSDGPPLAVTITHGRFGDLVRFPGGRTFASWYPDGLLGFEEGLDPPPDWDRIQRDAIDDPALVRRMVEGLASYIPEVRDITDVVAKARVVVARGTTDIDDPASGLHERSEAHVHVEEGWVSVRSPKLTTAPLVARWAAEAVLAET